jgi:hypothetical protein
MKRPSLDDILHAAFTLCAVAHLLAAPISIIASLFQ